MCVWMPPPPGDRLFWSFLEPPRLELRARPQIGGRLVKYAYHASRASAWIQSRMELSFKKNIVFPGGGDFVLPLLMPVDNPRAADGLPGLEAPPHRGAGGQRSAPASPLKRVDVGGGGVGGGRQGAGAPAGRAEPAPPAVAIQVADHEDGDGHGAACGGATPAAQHAAAAKPFVQLQLRRRSPGGAGDCAPEAAAAAVFPAGRD